MTLLRGSSLQEEVSEGLRPEARDQWNADLQRSLLREADVFLSLPRLDGRRWLRAVLLNPFTETEHIDALFDHVDRFATQPRA